MSIVTKLAEIDLLSVGNTTQMVGVIYAKQDGGLFLVPFPEDRDGVIEIFDKSLLDLEILSMDSGDWEKFLRQTDLLETEILQKASDGKLAKVVVRKSQRQIEQGVSWKVFRRDGYACVYCGANDVPLTVDHIVTWEAGGPSTESNLLSSCRKDNKIRGTTPYHEWLKHPHYLRVSKNLSAERRQANEGIVARLSDIPLVTHIRSR